MEKINFETILTVNNLNLCRTFYRDILCEPQIIVDSSFGVKFLLKAEKRVFSLWVKNPLEGDKRKTPQLKFIIRDACVNATLNKLQRYGVNFSEIEPRNENNEKLRIIAASDPEGNAVFLEIFNNQDNEAVISNTQKTQRLSL